MRQTGIWLDFNHANIIELVDGKVTENTIPSNIESYHLKGGSRSKTPWGPMDKTSESKHLERRKHQEVAYYKAICQAIGNSDKLFVKRASQNVKLFLRHSLTSYTFPVILQG